MKLSHYICPFTKSFLNHTDNGLLREDGVIFPYLTLRNRENPIPNFLEEKRMGSMAQISLEMYKDKAALKMYENYLNWLFTVFAEDESSVREKMVEKLNLKGGEQVLVTGCGLGDDLPYVLKAVGSKGEVYAQDISGAMVLHTQALIANHKDITQFGEITFSVGDALRLPFPDNFFHAAFHFGGINLFDDVKMAIHEMDRVVVPGGKVVFGDEGIAPWLRNTEYAKIAICNNNLWAAETPLSALPEKCVNANITWILGNCFYLIDFEVSDKGPYMNIDIHHKGKRGGSMRTRYYGQLEGVTPQTKEKVIKAASAEGISVHDWLEKTIKKAVS